MSNKIKISGFTGVLLCAAAYVITGKLGLLLAIPPGYATAVWPPSGIALGALVLFGRRLWPGVWLGSFLTNIATSYDPTNTATIVHSLSIAAVIGTGAALQAAVSATLIRRHLGATPQLQTPREIVVFFALAGPLCCLINSGVSVAALTAMGVIPTTDALYSWCTWWIGDTIGTLIFAPLVLMWCGPSEQWRQRRAQVTAPLVLTFVAAVLVFVYASRSDRQQMEQRFREHAELVSASVERRVELNRELLRSVGGLFSASQEVDPEEFSRFAALTLKSHREVQGLVWAPRVSNEYRQEFEGHLRERTGRAQIRERVAGQLQTAPVRAEYFPVLFIAEPATAPSPYGFDISAEPARKLVLEQARDTGEVTATGPITIAQDANHPDGLMFVLPVYRPTTALDLTVEERRESLLGFAVAVLTVEQLVNDALTTLPAAGNLHFNILDTATASPTLLYGMPQQMHRRVDNANLHYEIALDAGARPWLMQFESSLEQQLLEHSVISWLVLAGGLLFSALIGSGALLLTGRTAEVQALVQARTTELAEINEKLSVEICDHISTEVALERERAFLNTVLENLNEGILVLNPDGKLRMTNSAARRTQLRISGMEPGLERWGKHFMLYYPDGETVVPHKDLPRTRAMAGETVRDFEMVATAPGREPVVLCVTSQPLLDADGTTNGVVSVVRDITETKRAERLKQEFVAVVSHELRTPLTSIRGSLGLVCGGAGGEIPEKARRLLDIAYRNSDRLTLLINDLLDIEKMDSGKTQFALTHQSIRTLVTQALDANSGYAQNCNVRLVLQPDADDAQVQIDGNRLLQVLANLLSNAAKFSPPNSTVEVGIHVENRHCRVSVIDQGAGIPAEFRSRIFQKFSQADASDNRAKGGTGLGLAISKAIIEQLGGTIGYESYPGNGTRFYFDLPVDER
jgi:PAS domain S-box-containing protein